VRFLDVEEMSREGCDQALRQHGEAILGAFDVTLRVHVALQRQDVVEARAKKEPSRHSSAPSALLVCRENYVSDLGARLRRLVQLPTAAREGSDAIPQVAWCSDECGRGMPASGSFQRWWRGTSTYSIGGNISGLLGTGWGENGFISNGNGVARYPQLAVSGRGACHRHMDPG